MNLDNKISYCSRCCMPNTSEGINFDELDICKGCQSSEDKMKINWHDREKELAEILNYYKEKSGDNYDCIVPISGGKDSAFQLHVLVKKYNVKPLAVTFSHNWFSEVGKRNLWRILEELNVDHLLFTPARNLVNKIAKKSLVAIGDSCWHCHAGVGAYPLSVAVMTKIPLLVWGESPSEAGNKSKYSDNDFGKTLVDGKHYLKVSAKVHPDEMIDETLTKKDLYPFKFPSEKELNDLGLRGIHLGDYIFWDGERQVDFLKSEYGWEEDKVEGTYKGYKSCECIMPGVHDFTKYLKRGFGRTTDHVSQDVRAGLLTREEGFEIIRKFDGNVPEKSLKYFLEITGYSEEEFYQIMEEKRKEIDK